MGIYHAIPQGKTERRCASLRRGARAWSAEMRYRGGAKRGAVLLTLTFDTPRSDAYVSGAVRRFWDLYAKHFARTPARRCGGKSRSGDRCKGWAVVTTERCIAHGGVKPEGGDPDRHPMQRLSWLEYQRNGRHHYHAVILDPPPRIMGHDWTVVQRLWAEGRTQLLWRNVEWVDHQAERYAMSYAKKFGAKSYQQQYEQATKAIRTYQNNRLRSADARLERLPRWCHHAAREHGHQLIDGRRGGGGIVVESTSIEREAGMEGSQTYLITIDHQVRWYERKWWPDKAVVVWLGAVEWVPLTDVLA
jgi:hypothetical protein